MRNGTVSHCNATIANLVKEYVKETTTSTDPQPGRVTHRQPKLNIREPLNYKDLYGNTTDLCKMVETNIVLSIKST